MRTQRVHRVTAWLTFSTLLGMTGCLELEHSSSGGLKPGDRVETETETEVETEEVVSTTGPVSCQVATLSVDAEWDCSEEQLAIAQGTATTTTTVTATATTPDGVELDVTDCDSLADLRRPALRAIQKANLDLSYRSLLYAHCFPRTRTAYFVNGEEVSYCNPNPPSPTAVNAAAGSPAYGGGDTASAYPSSYGADPAAPQPAANQAPVSTTSSAPAEPSEGASEYSTTNTQVVGVDEADFVKNDAEHIYVLSPDGLRIFDAWPVPELNQVAYVPFDGEPRRLFLSGDRLVVYLRHGVSATATSDQGCTYAYSCRFSSEGGTTEALVFDVAEPEHPELLGSYSFSGSYVASRRVGPTVYTVVHDSGQPVALPGVSSTLEAESAEDAADAYEKALAAADRSVDEIPAGDFLPWVRSFDAEDAMVETPVCNQGLAAGAAAGLSFVSLVSFDLEKLGTATRTLVASKPGFVYASPAALYLAVDGIDGQDNVFSYQGVTPDADRSTVHKFSLDGTDVRYVGSHAISGHVLNQFSMDEYEGVLRVATTSGWVPNTQAASNITTLSEREGELSLLGELTGLAPAEDIRSVRFDGDRGFVVTFKKTDPLFVIGLQNPETPSVLGELKIPGFSTYMHRLDENHLLAVGFDADDQGSFAYFDGIQIQIFDVSDLQNPILLHKTIIGTRGSGSEALMNHLAFNYFPAKNALALPATLCDGGDNGVYANRLGFSGLLVFDVSLENGITEIGGLPFAEPLAETASVSSADCQQWWSDSTSLVKRSIFMEDYAIGISDNVLKAAALDNLSEVLQSLPLSGG